MGPYIKLFLSFALAFTLILPSHSAQEDDGLELADAEQSEDESLTLTGTYLAAYLASGRRNIPKAADLFREALVFNPDSEEIITNTFLLELADGRFENALSLAETLVKDDDTGLAQLALAAKALKERRYKKARKLISTYQAEPFVALIVQTFKAWAYQAEGNIEQAIAELQQIEGPEWVDLFKTYHQAMIYDLHGEKVKTLRAFEKAYEIDPQSLRVTQAYMSALSRAGDSKKAKEVADVYIEELGEHPILQHDLEILDNGRVLKPSVFNAQQGFAELLYGLGASISQDGTEEVAAIYLQLALYLNDNIELASISIATIYERLGLKEEAIKLYTDISKNSAIYTSTRIQMALLHEELEQNEQADDVLLSVLKANPKHQEALNVYANILRSREDHPKATEYYSKLVDLIDSTEERHWVIFYARGISYEQSDQWKQAEAD